MECGAEGALNSKKRLLMSALLSGGEIARRNKGGSKFQLPFALTGSSGNMAALFKQRSPADGRVNASLCKRSMNNGPLNQIFGSVTN